MKVAAFSLLVAFLSSSGTSSAVMANDGGISGRKLDSSGAKSGKGGSCDLTDPAVNFHQYSAFAVIVAGLCDTLGAGLSIGGIGDEQDMRRAIPLTSIALQVLGGFFSTDTATIVAADVNEDGYLEPMEIMPVIMSQFRGLCPDEVYALAPFFGVGGWYGFNPGSALVI